MFKRKPTYKNNVIAALDLGTTKVACAIARLSYGSPPQVIGVGQQMTRGLKRGIIIDMDAVATAVAEAMTTAERQADESVRKVYIGVPAQALISQIQGIEVHLDQSVVEVKELQSMFHRVQQAMQKEGKEVLHVFPLSFELDGQKGIVDPKDMVGRVLKAHLHIVTIPANVLRNYFTCLNKAHIEVAGIVASPYAAALSTLTHDEMDLGSVLIEMGGGTTSMIGYLNEKPVFMTSVPIGGTHVTQDIARVFSTPISYAERLKVLFGSAQVSISDERDSLSIPQIGESEDSQPLTASKAQVNQVILSRLEEIFIYLQHKLAKHPENQLFSRVVLTGGASQLNGMKEFSAQILKRSVRLGTLSHMGGFPSGADFSTCAGVLMYAMRETSLEFTHQHMHSRVKNFWSRLSSMIMKK